MGGIDYDDAVGIGVDSAGNVYVAGSALSDAASFPQTANGYDLVHNGYDAFLTKFDASGTRVYSTFLGGTGGDNYNVKAGGLAIDDQAGLSDRRHLQHRLSHRRRLQATFSGPNGYDAYLAVIDTTVPGVGLVIPHIRGPGRHRVGCLRGLAAGGHRRETGVFGAQRRVSDQSAYDATFNGSGTRSSPGSTSCGGNASLLFRPTWAAATTKRQRRGRGPRGDSRGRRRSIENFRS
jgi:hypothetical protein